MTELIDNLIIKRRINIAECLNQIFINDISKLISEYDYYLEGKSCIFSIHNDAYNETILANKYLFSATYYNGFKLWNLQTGICDIAIEDESMITCVALDEQKMCLVTGYDDGTLKVWNLSTKMYSIIPGKNYYQEKQSSGITCVMFLTDNRIVSGSNDSTLKIWNLQTGKCDVTLEGTLYCCIS
jgi:WD40 repeat protein